jgi:hypothetical protein
MSKERNMLAKLTVKVGGFILQNFTMLASMVLDGRYVGGSFDETKLLNDLSGKFKKHPDIEHAYMDMYALHTRTHACTHAHTHTHVCVCKYIIVYIYIYIYIYITYTHTHINIYTYMQTCMRKILHQF